MSFKEIKPKPDFPVLEKEITKYWDKNKVLEKYLEKNKDSEKRFSFLDGPITANNPMGVHHAWGRTLKDLYQRYKNMQGFKQRFQNGFDNQGLWVEVEVEKKMGFKNKKDIEKYGIDKFVKKCKEHTLHFAKVQIEQSQRLGYFMDWGNDYYTMSDENNYAIWHFLKKCWKNGWLYKGEDVVPWCPRCGTAISQHEILTGDYKELTHKAVYVKYPVVGKKNEYLLVWTTTPWTLPANVAIAFNPSVEYDRAKQGKDTYILAKNRLEVLKGEYEVIEELKSNDLAGLKYEGAFKDLDIVKENLKQYLVVEWKDGVTEEDGTGLVHMSTGSGPEDYQYGKEIGLPIFPVLTGEGMYVNGYNDFSGKDAAKIGPTVIKELEKRQFLYKEEDFTHRYPLCWRCKTELLFRLVDEWYISMDELRYKMMEVTKKIKWIPAFGEKLELDWLKNMHDWLISKKRYWGLSVPIWECECGHFEVIGSKQELEERAVEGLDQFVGKSPHRPWTDKIKIECPKCKEKVSRIPDVGNPWLDAGIVPYSTLKYFEDRPYWKKWFPADLVLECFPGQFKNWFYSMIAMSSVLEEINPFKTLLGHNLVKDEKGEEMHKSSGNAIEFNKAADGMGADIMRWMYARQNPPVNLNFGYGPANEIKKRFFFILWNCFRFFTEFANVDKVSFERIEYVKKENLSVLDKWILSRMNHLIKNVTKYLDEYDHHKSVEEIESFVSDLSLWYIRRSRDRVGPGVKNGKNKVSFYETFHWVITILMRLMAPVVPFFTENIWQLLGKEGSIHLQDWPEVYEEYLDPKLEKDMERVREICSLTHSIRKDSGVKARQLLNELKIINFKDKLEDELVELIRSEINVKEVTFMENIDEQEGWVIKKEEDFTIGLDIRITPELKEQGMAREVIRQIQKMRKQAGYKPIHKIKVQYSGTKDINELLDKNQEFIAKETISDGLVLVKDKKSFDVEADIKIDGQDLWLGIKKT